VINADPAVLAKIMAAKDLGKLIDGHAPGLQGQGLNAYAAAGILADHECSTAEEARARLARGLYVMLRQGSSCHDLAQLLDAVNADNYTRCLLCSDDRHADTILKLGHINEHLQICVQNGLSPLQALRMATLNTAEAFGLKDRGALFPGRKADLTFFEDLHKFKAKAVYIDGELVAQDGHYLPAFERADTSSVRKSFHLGNFSKDKLVLRAKSKHLRSMIVQPGGVLTKAGTCHVDLDHEGRVLLPADQDLVYLAVVERHKNTGNVGLGILEGYGLKSGAIATSIAHDSHNILVAGRNQSEMAKAVEDLVEQEGGVVLVQEGKVIANLPLPIAGLMSEEPATELAQSLSKLEELAHSALGISREIDPVMTLSFMSLAVIPELKLTDLGLFDVTQFKLVGLEA
jgi:adenine deaminase